MIRYAKTFSQRLKGLLWGKEAQQGGYLVLAPCCDVHTFFMRKPIDVAFVDKNGWVLSSRTQLQPFRRMKCSGAAAVVERLSKQDKWLDQGEYVCWAIKEQSRDA